MGLIRANVGIQASLFGLMARIFTIHVSQMLQALPFRLTQEESFFTVITFTWITREFPIHTGFQVC